MKCSVIICTHNPRPDYLERTLDALRVQTLPTNDWELLVVDNASDAPLAARLNLSWQTQARVISEPALGILSARVRGLKESCSPFVLFVDDDNVLAPDYLEQAMAIAETHPFLGVWGGSITPEFETPPPLWIDEFRLLLACGEVLEDRWSNLKSIHVTVPPTAGMCLRRAVAEAFIQLVKNDPRRQILGRRGKTGLTNCEDTDLALTACDIGQGTGQFARLKMTHLIPTRRVDENYLLQLAEGTYYSGLILEALRGRPPVPYPSRSLRAWLSRLRCRLFWSRRRHKLFEGELRARRRACDVVATWQ